MRFGTAIERLVDNYQYAKSKIWIRDKVAWALYHTWKEADDRKTEQTEREGEWMTYTEKELDQFLHGISLSLLSKKSAQHWRYDEETAKEIEWLEALERKVRADKADRKTEPQTERSE